MDEFMQDLKKKSDVIVINAKTISEKSNEMLVLGTRDNYELNTKLRMLPGVRFIHPDSSEGKFFANDDTIARADDFFKNELVIPEGIDYSILSAYKSLPKKPLKEELQIVQPVKESPQIVEVADDYNKSEIQTQVLTSNVVPIYALPQFNPASSWYSQMPARGLETIVNRSYYMPRRGASNPAYYGSSKRDVFNPYEGQKKPENLFQTLYKKAA